MAVHAYLNFEITAWSGRAPGCGGVLKFVCDTTAEMNALVGNIDGDRAFSVEANARYLYTGGVWSLSPTDPVNAGTIWGGITGPLSDQSDLTTALNAKQATSAKGQANGYASLDGAGRVPVAQLPPGSPTAWGAITGTLSAQTDLQTALDGKQVVGSYPTGSGTSSGTNTGDQTSVSGNAGTATALQTARTINGISFDGTANINIPVPALAGPTGKAGTQWRAGATVPARALGLDGDFYLNTKTKAIAQKAAGQYVPILSLAVPLPVRSSATLLHRV